MTSGDPPAIGLSARFAQIIGAVCLVLGAYDARERTAGPFVLLIRRLLHRRLARFEALMARFHAGTLPVARHRETSFAPAERAMSERAWDPMPRNHGWVAELDCGAGVSLEHFEHLLAHPEMAALLAAGPQAGRLLRPLWRMVSAQPLPPILRAPPRRRRTRLAAPAGSEVPRAPPRSRWVSPLPSPPAPEPPRSGEARGPIHRSAPYPTSGTLYRA